uniref:Aldose 1-epimerase n=1 Tax=Clastoptera arizonana TaxID=38151 RepID=A0A1B6CZK7_9HEMI
MAGTNKSTKITEDFFGLDSNGNKIRRFTLMNQNSTIIQIIDYGATVTSIKVADIQGKIEDVALGFDDMRGYQSKVNPYFGATVGRVANRVCPTDFEFNGEKLSLTKNITSPLNVQLHGGIKGFDKVIWNASVEGDSVVFTYVSKDGEEGYPGTVLATSIYQLTSCNKLNIQYKAVVSKPTMVNLTNHSYFNLAGHGSGSKGLLQQVLTVNADYYTPLEKLIPTGKLNNVSGTGYDLRTPRKLSEAFAELDTDGYDINFCINQSFVQPGFVFAARIIDPDSGRYLEVSTNQPGVQVYTSNAMDDFEGKGGAKYGKHSAICFETQQFPNAIHNKTFPSIIVRPGEEYCHLVSYAFGVIQ